MNKQDQIILLSVLVFLLLCFNCCAVNLRAPSSRLLFVSIHSPSHVNVLIAIAHALPSHHHVTFGVFDKNVEMVRNKLGSDRSVAIVSFGPVPNVTSSREIYDGESNLSFMSRVELPGFLDQYVPMHDVLFTHLQTHSYDMMIVDMFAFAAQDLAHDLNVPMVVLTTFADFGVVGLPAWIPIGVDASTEKQLRHSFVSRFYNGIVMPFMIISYLGPSLVTLDRLRYISNRTILSTVFGLSSLIQYWQGHPILVYNPLAFDTRRAYTPNYQFIGFVHDIQERDQMNKIKEFLPTNEWLNKTQIPSEFVVVVVFGTMTVLNERLWQIFIDTLQLVPHMRLLLVIPQQTIRIKIEELLTSSVDQRSRVLIVSWVAQQHVLLHPAVRILITHGGLNTIGEAVYALKPLLILPGFGDQYANAARVVGAEIGLFLNRYTVTAAQLAEHIELINLNYDHYVRHLTRMHQLSELEGGGAHRAAKLIDGWLLTGYTHLDTLDHHLSFLVANSLDVRLTFLLLLIIIIYLLFRLVTFLLCSLFCHRKQKQA